jgi:hypothetical protein
MAIDKDGKRFVRPTTHLDTAASTYRALAPEAKDRIKERKQRFAAINEEIMKAGGWVTSIPGDRYIDFEVLEGNPLPRQIRYEVEPNGSGERILPHSVVERFTKNADGTLSLLTEGSTKEIASRVTHAGIARVTKFFFLID